MRFNAQNKNDFLNFFLPDRGGGTRNLPEEIDK